MTATDPQLYSAITRDIIVMVQPEYLPGHSSPEKQHFVWSYHVTIENGGNETVTLLRRQWMVIDAAGQKTEVQGDGVVGEQPVILPGAAFRYASYTPLPTASGMMFGHYFMRLEKTGEEFSVTIPAFSLDSAALPVLMH